MANAEQLKALLKSHMEGDDDRFFSVAMQVAAHEAKLGHGKLAKEMRTMIDEAKGRRGVDSLVPIGRPSGELANLLEASYPKTRLSDMVLDDALAEQIKRVIREQRHAGRIVEHGLSPRRKLLLTGLPGTGQDSNRVRSGRGTRPSALSGPSRWPYHQVHGGNCGQAAADIRCYQPNPGYLFF